MFVFDLIPFRDLLGKTLTVCELHEDGTSITFICDDGTEYLMKHEQDCCESVWVEDIIGDLNDLLYAPILMADEETSGQNPLPDSDVSHTWTFFKLATMSGYVTIRWYGSSNGYYSESADLFIKRLEE